CKLDNQVFADDEKIFRQNWPDCPDNGAFFQNVRNYLIAAGRGAELVALLQDMAWIQAKVDRGLVGDLLQDYRVAMSFTKSKALAPWFYFIQGNAPVLMDHPELLFQQAWNEPRNSPVSNAARSKRRIKM